MHRLDGNVRRQEMVRDHTRSMVDIGMKSIVVMEDMKRIGIRDIMDTTDIMDTNIEVIRGILAILMEDVTMMIGIRGDK